MQFGDDRPQLSEQVQTLIALVDNTMRVVRGVVSSLRPAALDAGIVAALERLSAEFNRSHRTACHLRVQEENLVLGDDRAIVLFRVVQEALTNVARHAVANRVTITLERTLDAYLLEARDDGQGFEPPATKKRSFGLAGMEERVLMLGGQFAIVSSPGNGTAIKVRVPDHQVVPT